MNFFNEAGGWSALGVVLASIVFVFIDRFLLKKKGCSIFFGEKEAPKEVVSDPTLTEKISALEKESSHLNAAKVMFEERARNLTEMHQKEEEEIEKLKKNIEDLQEQKRATEEELNRKIEELNRENTSLKVNRADLNKDVEQLPALKRERDDYKKSLEEVSLKNTELEKKQKEWEGKEETWNFEKKTHEETIARLSSKTELLEKVNKELSESEKESSKKYEVERESKANLQKLLEDRESSIKELGAFKAEYEKVKELERILSVSHNFYQQLQDRGIERNVDSLSNYRNFFIDNFQRIEELNERERIEQDRLQAAKKYEEDWGLKLRSFFTKEELDYIEITPQPEASNGDKGDFEVVFRNTKNIAGTNPSNIFRIMVEVKYSTKDETRLGFENAEEHKSTKKDLSKALELVRSRRDVGVHHLLILVTNRDIGDEAYRETEIFSIASDSDFKEHLGTIRQEMDPIIMIMTPISSWRFLLGLWMAYKWSRPLANETLKIEYKESIDISEYLKQCSSFVNATFSARSDNRDWLIKQKTELDKLSKRMQRLIEKESAAIKSFENEGHKFFERGEYLALTYQHKNDEAKYLIQQPVAQLESKSQAGSSEVTPIDTVEES
ncbi:hypothetical protein MHLP_02720 [Candidatus Mycoplasma haematolamae str. Purdue]|uniref:Uncharacterized protein n=1 Tax=Mycoplasma haematolamae (strain Purdue) TaxID=1212765 RepID=I7CJT1_MYCHA|nr:hypothetical protein [Candidatus Mycoplasma haematolamae]AFO52124.1 hypothetical protein MHLP_02720 [Candidatus Mycoplasma haematolamae str. Purdue]